MRCTLFVLLISVVNLSATISQIAFHDSDLGVGITSYSPIYSEGTIVDYDSVTETYYFNVVNDPRIIRNQTDFLNLDQPIYVSPNVDHTIGVSLFENFSYQGKYDSKVMSTSIYYKILQQNSIPQAFTEITRLRNPYNSIVENWTTQLAFIGEIGNPLLNEGEQIIVEFFYSVNVADWDDLGSQSTYTFNNNSENYKLSIIATPEPSALSLLAIGLGGLAMMRRRRS